MLNINPTNSSQIARSVQRDYQRAAEVHRLTKEQGHQLPKVSLAVIFAILIAAVAIMAQIPV